MREVLLMNGLVLVDLCNVKRWSGMPGSIRQAIKIVAKKVSSFVEQGYEVEIVVDSSRLNYDSSIEREPIAQNIECVFTCVEENGMQLTADDHIFSEVSKNLKEKEYDRIVLITDDLKLRESLHFLMGPKFTFNLEPLGVLDFLNNKNSLV
jgi:hypothetical protein